MWASLMCANLLRQLLVYVLSELLVYPFIQLFVICLLHPSQDLRPAVLDPKVGDVCQAVEELKSGQGESHIRIRQHLEVLGGKTPPTLCSRPPISHYCCP